MASRKPIDQTAIRAAKCSRIPGITIAQAAARYAVPVAEVRRARRDHAQLTTLSVPEIALIALTQGGTVSEFQLDDLKGVASWVDYLNKDACSESEVRAHLATLVAQGIIELDGEGGRLLAPWP